MELNAKVGDIVVAIWDQPSSFKADDGFPVLEWRHGTHGYISGLMIMDPFEDSFYSIRLGLSGRSYDVYATDLLEHFEVIPQ